MFTNWNHGTQTVTGPLTFEQCTFKAFETEAPFITFNPADGRCICKDETAVLTVSTENSFAYSNECNGGTLSTNDSVFTENTVRIFPNPVTNKLNVKLKDQANGELLKINILSVDGKLISESTVETIDRFSVDTSSLASGVYFFGLTLNAETNYIKFVVR